MEEWIRLEEAARVTGKPESTLRRILNTNAEPSLRSRKMPLGKREIWEVEKDSLLQTFQLGSGGQYEELYQEWVETQKNGIHTGKPLGASSVHSMEQGLANFWHYAQTDKLVKNIEAESLSIALSRIPVDYENKNCHYGIRHIMYSAVVSFSKLLVRKGLKPKELLHDLRDKRIRPKRVFPPRKTVLDAPRFNKLLKFNDVWRNRRSDTCIQLTRTILMLGAMAGLRKSDIVRLEMDHIDFTNRILYIVDSKGHKNRRVGIVTDLLMQLQAWKTMRPSARVKNFLVNGNGSSIKNTIDERLNSLVAAYNREHPTESPIDLTLHGLRRTFATVNTEAGMPLTIAQKLLGHSNINITMGYVMTDEMAAVDYLRNQ